MSKKKQTFPDDILAGIFANGTDMQKKSWSEKELKDIFSKKDPRSMSSVQRRLLIASAIFIQNNITPDNYKTLFDIASEDPVVNLMPLDLLFNDEDETFDDETFDDDDDGFFNDHSRNALMAFPLPDADKKSMILRIQLRGVKKPPLWREVKVPASINFHTLHKVIQILFGWENSHLWQFEETPYSRGYLISEKKDDMGFSDSPTDIAEMTPVTKVLKNKGDKMVYIYDFGDDWIHDISVKEVIDEPSPYPVCTKWKSDNPMEDIGGVWGLEEIREMADPEVRHTRKEEKEFLDNHWFDSMKEFKEFMDEHKFDLRYVNGELEAIKPLSE